MLYKCIPLFKAALVEQQFDAFACGEFAAGVLCIDARLPATECRRLSLLF
jgi:hypothetical protein